MSLVLQIAKGLTGLYLRRLQNYKDPNEMQELSVILIMIIMMVMYVLPSAAITTHH